MMIGILKNSISPFWLPITLFMPYMSVSFAPYLSSITLFRGIFVVRHAAARTTNLPNHDGLAARSKTLTLQAASWIPVVHRLA
jgi:hypothetical protein